MDEMTEKQEEATRVIEAIGTTTLNECYVPVSNSFTLDDMRSAYDAAVFNPNDQTFDAWIKQAYNVC